jgi:hypothetical protein
MIRPVFILIFLDVEIRTGFFNLAFHASFALMPNHFLASTLAFGAGGAGGLPAGFSAPGTYNCEVSLAPMRAMCRSNQWTASISLGKSPAVPQAHCRWYGRPAAFPMVKVPLWCMATL